MAERVEAEAEASKDTFAQAVIRIRRAAQDHKISRAQWKRWVRRNMDPFKKYYGTNVQSFMNDFSN